MSYIVTGGAGFIGSNMIKKLNENNITDIIIIDSYSEDKMKNILDLKFNDFIDFKDGIKITEDNLNKIKNPEGIFHIGGNTDVLSYDIKTMMYENFEFSKMYCKYANEKNIPFIYTSSSAIYGNSKNQSVDNNDINPHNIYAWSKWLFDKYIIANKDIFYKVIGFRLFNVFGQGESYKDKNASIIYRFYKFIKEKQVINLFNKEIIRDYVYVNDVTEVMFQTMFNYNIINGIYNLGGNNSLSNKQIAELVINTMIEENVINKNDINNYINLIEMPKEISNKFQFYTHSDKQLDFISNITKDNNIKIKQYIKTLIKKDNE